MPDFMLCVDKIQADPFAAPSRLHVVVPGRVAGFPAEAFSTKARTSRVWGFFCVWLGSFSLFRGVGVRTSIHGTKCNISRPANYTDCCGFCACSLWDGKKGRGWVRLSTAVPLWNNFCFHRLDVEDRSSLHV